MKFPKQLTVLLHKINILHHNTEDAVALVCTQNVHMEILGFGLLLFGAKGGTALIYISH